MATFSGNPQWQPSVATLSGHPQWQPSMATLNGNPQWQPSVATLSGNPQWQPSVATLSGNPQWAIGKIDHGGHHTILKFFVLCSAPGEYCHKETDYGKANGIDFNGSDGCFGIPRSHHHHKIGQGGDGYAVLIKLILKFLVLCSAPGEVLP